MSEPNQLHRIPLPDGRIIAVAEYGDAAGVPLLFFHGTPGSHCLAGLIAEKAHQNGFRILAPDRPGLGFSTNDPQRSFLSVAEDVRHALDHLGLSRVHLVGISGGGPYALAAARVMPERLGHITLLSPWWFPHGAKDATQGLDRVFRTYEWTVRRCAPLSKGMARLVAAVARKNPAALVKNILRHAPPDDQHLLADPAVQAILVEDITTSFRQGWKGGWRESTLHFSPHGFEVADIHQPITIHHGAKDNIVPFHFAEKLAAKLPNATLHVEPEGGHFVAIRLQDRVFAALRTTSSSAL